MENMNPLQDHFMILVFELITIVLFVYANRKGNRSLMLFALIMLIIVIIFRELDFFKNTAIQLAVFIYSFFRKRKYGKSGKNKKRL